MMIRCSRPALICAWAKPRTGCVQAFCPVLGTTVSERLEQLSLHRFDLSEGAVLETGCVYIVPLMEALNLPEYISAAANPKSSTGRLDVFTRVIADNAQEFDQVPGRLSRAALCGNLSAHVSPFLCVPDRGSRRSVSGVVKREASDELIRQLHDAEPLDHGRLGQY